MKKNFKSDVSKGTSTISKYFPKVNPSENDSIEEFCFQKAVPVNKSTLLTEENDLPDNANVKRNKKVHDEVVGMQKVSEVNFILQETNGNKIVAPTIKNSLIPEVKKRKVPEDKFSPPHKRAHGDMPLNPPKEMSKVQINRGFKSQENMQTDTKINNNLQENCSSKTSEEISILSMEFDDWEDEMMEATEDFNLDLSKPCHCKILNISPTGSKIVLKLSSTKYGYKGMCHLEGFWVYTNLKVDSIVYITAKSIDGVWVVNNEYGLLIFEPDSLISPTAILGSLWCKRKSLLGERFRGFDSTNKAMLLGNLVHSTLQSALRHSIFEIGKIKEIVRKFVRQKRVLKALYECDISLETFEMEVFQYVPKIVEFLKCYVDFGHTVQINKGNWIGKIDAIDDIEENIWCPELGIKGKIDVTVRSKRHIMPLEIKTGRASFSLEHRGQIMFYIMMMKQVGYDVSSGLLLYLKDGVLREIPSSEKEERDLIRLRNELVHFLNKRPKTKEEGYMLPPELPEPIDHPSCANCGYQNICTIYSQVYNEDITSKKHLKKIQRETLSYLHQSHIDYFVKWTCMLIIEGQKKGRVKDAKQIYLVPPEEREQNGRCITNLELKNISGELDEQIKHTFERFDDFDFLSSGIAENNYVVVSTEKRFAVAAGLVTDITSNSVSIMLERNLNKRYNKQKFCIDSYDSSMIETFQFSSLALLLENTPKAENLRKIIIDKIPPTFRLTLPKIIGLTGRSILKRLNIVQQRAVLKAISANEYFLIKGMPGTGKTSTIVALIQLLNELGNTVLITSHTNSAVDNVCLKLKQFGVKFLRLGSELRIHKDLKEYSEHETKNFSTPKQYEDFYNSPRIVAVTCIASGHPLLTKRSFDFCIVDESTQVIQSSVIRPLYACKTFILIGDPDQLPAVVKNEKAKDLGMSESLFERLYSPEATMALNINYRMNKTITSVANCLTYNGELQVGNESIENATISIDLKNLEEVYEKNSWIFKILDCSLESAMQFLDTGPVWSLSQDVSWKIIRNYNSDSQNDENARYSNINIYEAGIIFKIIKALLKGGIKPEDIGVIASYRHQVEQLALVLDGNSIDVNTVDQFQGKDKSVIIYSCGNSRDTTEFKTPGKHDILEDKRRLNVAITRAKHKLLIVGDIETLMVYSTFKKLLSFFSDNVIKLFECENFSWENVLNLELY